MRPVPRASGPDAPTLRRRLDDPRPRRPPRRPRAPARRRPPASSAAFLAGYSEKVRVAETRAAVDRARRARPQRPAALEPDAPRAGRRARQHASSSSSTTRTSAGPRPGWTPRTLDRRARGRPGDVDRARRAACSPARPTVGIVARRRRPRPDPAAQGHAVVTISGPIGECVLYVYGRKDVAEVDARRSRRRRRRRRRRAVRPLTAAGRPARRADGAPGIGCRACLARSWGPGCCAPRTPRCSPGRRATSTTSTCPASCTPSSPAPRSPTPRSAPSTSTTPLADARRRRRVHRRRPRRRAAPRRSSPSTPTSPARRSPTASCASSARRSPSSSPRRSTAAADGAAAVWADYEPLDAIVDPEAAFDDDAPVIFPDHGIEPGARRHRRRAARPRGRSATSSCAAATSTSAWPSCRWSPTAAPPCPATTAG